MAHTSGVTIRLVSPGAASGYLMVLPCPPPNKKKLTTFIVIALCKAVTFSAVVSFVQCSF